MDSETTQNRSWEGTETYTFKVINNKTGAEEIVYPNVKGGLFIMNCPQNAGEFFGTDQGVFGSSASIAIALFKLPDVMRDIVKNAHIDDVLQALEQTSGEKWELRK